MTAVYLYIRFANFIGGRSSPEFAPKGGERRKRWRYANATAEYTDGFHDGTCQRLISLSFSRFHLLLGNFPPPMPAPWASLCL
uniref:Uncharacterized protein n=1 Tax=Physcomitrium patens TaxID=3218 RepID=A0A2K1JN29_PHYPA|nr:hypothetical protein PHYPA_017773 [Physcomitrium patens]